MLLIYNLQLTERGENDILDFGKRFWQTIIVKHLRKLAIIAKLMCIVWSHSLFKLIQTSIAKFWIVGYRSLHKYFTLPKRSVHYSLLLYKNAPVQYPCKFCAIYEKLPKLFLP